LSETILRMKYKGIEKEDEISFWVLVIFLIVYLELFDFMVETKIFIYILEFMLVAGKINSYKKRGKCQAAK